MKVAGLGVVSLRLQGIHLHMKSRIRDSGFVLLRHVQLTLLLEPRASVPLTQDLELGPVFSELLRETLLRLDGARRMGCWSWELEDTGGATCLLVYASWRLLSCGRTRVPEPVSWERVDCGGGGAPALAATLPTASDCSSGRSAAGCPVQS
jgi:hypothetical protein